MVEDIENGSLRYESTAARPKNFNKKKRKPREISSFDYALNLVSQKMQSTGQLQQKLARKGYSKEQISDTLAKLAEMNFTNDQQFGQIYFDNLKKYKNFGYLGIKKKLMERKLDSKLIEELLASFSQAEELEIAKRILPRTPKFAEKLKEKQRVARMLASRGFRSQVIMKAINLKTMESLDNGA